MIRPRWRKVLTDLWGNKIRSILVILSIAVGLFALGVIVSINSIILEDMRNGYTAVNPANIQVTASGINDQVVDKIRKMSGVKDTEAVHMVSLRIRTPAGIWNRIQLQAFPDFDNHKINLSRLIEGNWPPAYREIVLDQHKIADIGVSLGGQVELELASGKTRAVSLSGVVLDQTIGSAGGGGGFFVAPLQGYISLHTLEWLDEPTTYNMLYVTVSENPNDLDHIRQVASRISDEIENNRGVVISTVVRLQNEHPNSVYIEAISGVLLVLGLLDVFLSGFLITNTLSTLLAQQMRQIGVMKTVGARRWQIVSIYMVLIFCFGLLAFIIAMPSAARVSYILVDFLSTRLNFMTGSYRVVPNMVIAQALIALLVPQLAALVPIIHGSQINVHEALSGISSKAPAESSWFDRQINLIRGLSRPLLISLRNTFRHKGRLALTLFTLTLGGGIFIATFNVQEAMTLYIKRVSRYFLADVSLTMDKPYRTALIQQELVDFPGVKELEGWSYARCEVLLDGDKAGEAVEMLGVPPDSKQITPILIKGRWLTPGDQNAVVLNERFLSAYPTLKVGDLLRLRVNGVRQDWLVVGFFQLAGKSVGFRAYTDYGYLSHLLGQPNEAISFHILSTHNNLTIQQQKLLGSQIEVYLRQKGYSISDVTAGQYAIETSTGGLNALTIFLVFMATLTALVGAIGLMGTMSMNVLDRTREIGIMRAIGASDRMVMNLVIVEGLLIGLISWVVGSLLSFPISNVLSDTISQAIFDAPSILAYKATGFFVWLGLVTLLAVLASVIPARNAARLTIREVLAYE